MQVPQEYIDIYNEDPSKANWTGDRLVYAGMLTAADEGIGQIVDGLRDAGMWDDTVVVVTTDNGGPVGNQEYDILSPPLGTSKGYSNYPFRGGKGSVFEGGIKGDALLSGGALASVLGRETTPSDGTPRRSKVLFHGLDWLPTLAEMVGINFDAPSNTGGVSSSRLDGVSQYKALRTGEPARVEFHGGFSRNGRWGNPFRESAYLAEEMKLIWNDEDMSALGLFNLSSDIREEHDLSQQLPVLSQQIKDKMDQARLAFTEQAANDQEKCPYSEGVTQWGEPALILFCNESASTPFTPPAQPPSSSNLPSTHLPTTVPVLTSSEPCVPDPFNGKTCPDTLTLSPQSSIGPATVLPTLRLTSAPCVPDPLTGKTCPDPVLTSPPCIPDPLTGKSCPDTPATMLPTSNPVLTSVPCVPDPFTGKTCPDTIAPTSQKTIQPTRLINLMPSQNPSAPCNTDSVAQILLACLINLDKTNAAVACGRCYTEGIASIDIDSLGGNCAEVQSNVCGTIEECHPTCTPENKCQMEFDTLKQCAEAANSFHSSCNVVCSTSDFPISQKPTTFQTTTVSPSPAITTSTPSENEELVEIGNDTDSGGQFSNASHAQASFASYRIAWIWATVAVWVLLK